MKWIRTGNCAKHYTYYFRCVMKPPTVNCVPSFRHGALPTGHDQGQAPIVGWTIRSNADRKLQSEGGYQATWKREFKLPWRKAGLLKLSR